MNEGVAGEGVFMQGTLARLESRPTFDNANALLAPAKKEVFAAAVLNDDQLQLDRVDYDDQGFTQVRYRQVVDGTPVIGAELLFHVDPTGRVYAANGTARGDLWVGRQISLQSAQARNIVLNAYPTAAEAAVSDATFKYLPQNGELRPVFEQTVFVESEGTPTKDRVFVDAETGEILARHPLIWTNKSRETYTAKNGTSIPGTLLMREGGSTTDAVGLAAYTNVGTTYDYYKAAFSRDSYNNQGSTLISTVHYSRNYVNAYWNGSQMVYGDGDGVQSSPLAQSLDVTAHELSHGVTSSTSNLTYSYESGAINEMFSDVMAAATEAWKKGRVDDAVWLIGDDVWTPGTPGDALRYMSNPTIDDYSADFYPERLTGSGDSGGVHGNSGIGNLAFYLLSQGGKHPRGKTTNTVPALGIEAARAIFYRGNTVYSTASTNWEAFRTNTARAATDLYGATAAAAVHEAWNAVGVPGGGGGSSTSSELKNNVPVTALSGARNGQKAFTFTVPAGKTKLTFKMSGGTGDADLYVRFGKAPTTAAYDYRPYLDGNNETVTVNAPKAGVWYIMLNGYTTFSGVSLVAGY